jgi:selenocysteine-specific elongation factor
MIVGTAGHIDHGKTSLVKALTGVDADRLPEEKARGITLDLGYAYTRLATGATLGFVDVPGHERLVHNMLAGATGIDYVLLVVAADDGPMQQTREHLQILQLLGLDRGAVALTKIDVATPERVAEVQAEVRALLSRSTLRGATVFPVSSSTGEGVPALRAHLESECARPAPRRMGARFRLAIDRRFTLAGAGTVVTGTVFSGTVTTGDILKLSPSGISVRVRSVHAQNQPATHGSAGQRCALGLVGDGLEIGKVQRGDWILDDALHAPTQRLDATITLLPSEARALRHWTPVHVHIASVEVMARVALLESGDLQPGGRALAQLALESPIGTLHGDRFVIRDQSATRTLGGGVVLDPFPPARGRRTPVRLALLQGWIDVGAEQALRCALQASVYGLAVPDFARTWNLSPAQADEMARAAGARLAGSEGQRLAFSAEGWRTLLGRATDTMATEQARAPDMIGVGRERLRRLAMPALPQAAFEDVIDELIAAGSMQATGPWLHAPGHRAELTGDERALWSRVEPLLCAAPFHPPRVRDIAFSLALEEERVRRLLQHVARIGEVYPVAHDHYFTRHAVAELAAVIRQLVSDRGAASAAAFRDHIGTGRKLAIEILEFFDRIGFTRRVDDGHRLRQPNLFASPGVAPA